MEISPIIVSMKTASVSIVITFFLGLAAAYGVERIRSRKLQLVCDGILTLPLVPVSYTHLQSAGLRMKWKKDRKMWQ